MEYKMDSRITNLIKQLAGDRLAEVAQLAAELISKSEKSPERAYADALETLNLLPNVKRKK